MKSPSFISVVAFIAVASVYNNEIVDAQVNQTYACAPAQHCDRRSQLCRNTELVQALIRGEPAPKETFETSRGICTDAYKWICNPQGKACKLKQYTEQEIKERCKFILLTSRTDRDRFPDSMFVEACQEGFYTCNDGTCALLPGSCRTGVRYDRARCKADSCNADEILTEECKFNNRTIVTYDNIECAGDYKTERSSCCSKAPGPDCEYIQLVKRLSEVPKEECGSVCVPDTCTGTTDGGGGGSGEITVSPTLGPTTNDGTAAPTTETDPTLYDVVGMELSFRFTNVQRDCCCRLSCDCFGDPHCTSFFGRQETSKVSTGSFVMYELGKFSLTVELGPPQGVLKAAHVTIHNSTQTYTIDSISCLNDTHNWYDATTKRFFSKDELPSFWEAEYTQSGSIYNDPNTYRVRDQYAQVAVEIKCVSFFWEDAKDVMFPSNRLDIQVTKWSDLESGCCPDREQNLEWFNARKAKGFCVGNVALPGGFENSAGRSTGRLLKANDEYEYEDDNKDGVIVFGNEDQLNVGGSTNSSNPPPDNSAQKLCEKYLEAIKKAKATAIPALSTLEQCMFNIGDFGIKALEQLISILVGVIPNCISDPNDPRLTIPFQECEQGVVLQIRRPDATEFQDWRFLASKYNYCNDTLKFDFTRTRGVDARTEFRIRRCSPDPKRCGTCDALSRITDIQFRWLYECISYNGIKSMAQNDLVTALVDGNIACGFAYTNNPDPIACLRDNFPGLFDGYVVVVEDEDTKSPTRPTRPTRPARTNFPTKPTIPPSPTKAPVVVPTFTSSPTAYLTGKKCGDIFTEARCLRYEYCHWTGKKCQVKNAFG